MYEEAAGPIDIKACGLTAEQAVSPRFWEMRKLVVDFGTALINGVSNVENCDMVMVTNGTYEMGGPWIVLGRDDKGFYILGNGAGQVFRVPMFGSPLFTTVIAKAADAIG